MKTRRFTAVHRVPSFLLRYAIKRAQLAMPVAAAGARPAVTYATFRTASTSIHHAIRASSRAAAVKAHALAPEHLMPLVSPLGRVYGMTIVGHVSGELINEWTTIIQNRIRMHQVLFQMHSFPTMGFLSKRIAETWMMRRMQSAPLRRMAAALYRMMP